MGLMMSPTRLKQTDAHLLVVDDNPHELRLLVESLRAANYRITVAFDGMQAYRRAVAALPDLILMDVQMPVTSGFASCRLLQADPVTQHIPVIFLSSRGLLQERLEGLSCGGVDYVLKPFDPPEVLARIKVHLALSSKRLIQGMDGGFVGQATNVLDGEPGHTTPDEAVLVPLDLKYPGHEPSTAPLDGKEVVVKAVKRYLAANLAHPPKRELLARHVGINQKRLSQIFRECTGMGLYDFVREERLRSTQRLLVETSLSITDIAQEVGFSSGANLATAFRGRFGGTPTEYRSSNGRGTARDAALFS